jgi:3-deoxy-manno-octulosonate cytidylyltransferase (CMP-KDO synthetase)
MSFHVIIPARWASTRLPGKMLADLGGVPMVVRVAQQAQRSGARSVTIATDQAQIAEASQNHGFTVLMTSLDHPTGTDRLSEAVMQLGLDGQEIVVNVQGDEPFIDPTLIEAVAQALHDDPHADIATCASPLTDEKLRHNPNVVKVVCDSRGHALYFSRAPIPYDRDGHGKAQCLHHIGIYAYRVRFLKTFPSLTQGLLETCESLEQLRALEHGFKIHVTVTDKPIAGGIDTPEDLLKAQKTFKEAQ